MSRRVNPIRGPGPKIEKEQQDAMRKEQYGFANLVKEQQFRSTAQGDLKTLNDKVRELTDMLEDRKNANRLLATENQRLKKMCTDLQVQLLDKPTARGESAALKSMREMARKFQNRQQMTSAAAEKLISELMAQNQEAADEMQRLGDDRDGLMAELSTTREALSSASAEVAAYREQLAEMTEEKERLLAEKEHQALQAQQLDEQRQQTIAKLETDVEVLKQQLVERDAAAEAARLAAEAALRSQKAALEAEALLQRQAAVAEVEAQVTAIKQLLHKAHESLRSLNQMEALDDGWTIMEHGLQSEAGAMERQPEPEPLDQASPVVATVYAISARRARRSSHSGNSVRRSLTGSAGNPGGPAAVEDPMGHRPAAGSVGGSLQLEQSGNIGQVDAAAVASPVRSRTGSIAASVASRRSARASQTGVGDDGTGADAAVSDHADGDPPAATVDEGDLAAARPEKRPSSLGGSEAGHYGGIAEMPGIGTEHGDTEVTPVASSLGLKSTAKAEVVPDDTVNSAEGKLKAAQHVAASRPPLAPNSTSPCAPLIPAPLLGPAGNILELLLHDAALHPGAIGLATSDLWAHLRLLCPGRLPGLIHLALSTPGSGSGSQDLRLLRAIRLHFPDDQQLLTAVAGGAVQVQLQNLRPAVVGAFSCPRVVPTPAAGGGSNDSRQGGVGGAVADGTVERVMVVASRDEYNDASLELFCMDDEGRPTRPFQTLSAPWRQHLPDSTPQPRPDELCIDTQALHRLQADAARASGLFDLSALRVFIGRRDGHTYQVWRLADVETRRKASFKALGRVIVEPAENPWVGAAPLAEVSLPLAAALSSPTLARLELGNVKLLLKDQRVMRLYEPSEGIATRTLAFRTVASEKLVATLRVTVRLARDPEVSEQLLAALQPALQAGTGAPTLPPLHWLSLLGAEELVLERLVRELREAVGAATGRLMALPAHDDVRAAEVEALGRQAEDAVRLKERQLADGLASCHVIVTTATAGSPEEAPFARARLQQTRRRVARTLAEVTAFYRQRLELYRLGAVAWHFITEAAGSDDPVACLPVTTTRPQAKGLADTLQALSAALHVLTPPGTTVGELMPAAAPLALLLPPPPPPSTPPLPSPLAAAIAAQSPPPEAMELPLATSSALAGAAKDLELALRASVEAAAAAAGDTCEELRKQVAAPGADGVALVEAAQARLAAVAAPVTAALVGGMAGLCQAAVAASLAEPETVVALRDQLWAAAVAAAAGSPLLLAQRLSTEGLHLVAQLAMHLSMKADDPTTAMITPVLAAAASPEVPGPVSHVATRSNAATAAPQLSAALQSLQWLVGALTRAAPAPVAASPHSVAAWVKASVRLRLQLGVLCTTWSAAAVAAAGHALLLCGQRHAAVTLALEVMGREVDRVLDATKAALEALRANRSFDETLLADCMPPVATALTSHAAAAVTSCFWLAAQMVLTPLVVQAHTSSPSSSSPHNNLSASGSNDEPSTLREPRDLLNAGSTPGSSSSSSNSSYNHYDDCGINGACYSSSLHVSSCVSFTIVTMGNLRSVGLAPVPPPLAADHFTHPREPLLGPLQQPLLTTWRPRRAILYLDITRLNASAASAATASAAMLPPPPPSADTAALPHLPAAAEMLGWTLRFAEEFYDSYFTSAAVNAGDPGYKEPSSLPPKAPSGPPSAAHSAAPSVAPTPRGPAPPEGAMPARSRRGSVSGEGSVLAAADAPPPPPTAALATDPVAALSEAKLAARMAEEADLVVLAGGRLAEAGSLVKWLSQSGMLVIMAADLQQLPEAMAAAGSGDGSGDDGSAAAARALARVLVGLIAIHQLQGATVRTLTQPVAGGAIATATATALATPRPGGRSVAATPLTSLYGQVGQMAPPPPPSTSSILKTQANGNAATTTAVSPSAAFTTQPLAVLTYLPDLALAKPALAACGDLAHRADLALQALQAAFASAPSLAPHAAMLARHVSCQLKQQQLLLEGLLLAPALLRARHPGTVPLPGSVASAGAASGWGSGAWQPWGRVGDAAASPPLSLLVPRPQASAAPSPAPSRQGSLGRIRPALPAMNPKSGGSKHSLLTGASGGGGGSTAVNLGPTPRPLAAPAAPPKPPPLSAAAGTTDDHSTESEDEELGVSRIAPVARAGNRGAGLVGPMGYGGGGTALLPDEPDADSDAGSIASASTLGSLAGRSRIAR